MQGYHTQIVAGVTPGKGGDEVEGIPVFDTVQSAWDAVGTIDVSVLFIPAPLVKDAAIEALSTGVKLLVIVPDRVPIYDVLEIDLVAQERGATYIGPNTLGVLSPDKGVLGMMGGRSTSARDWFFPGPVGISSRSGGITTSIAYYLAQAGIGASTIVHVGGDAIVGMPHAEVLKQFEHDSQTEAVVLFGEIGTSQEEGVASLIEKGGFTKPVVAYIGGKGAKQGTRFSHAGAIIEGERGTYANKVARLRDVGVTIVESFADIPRVTAEVLKTRRTVSILKTTTKPADELQWATAITDVQPNLIRLRGYAIDKLMGNLSFSQAIYLALMGTLPSQDIGEMIDAILVSSIDHGATPPSALSARTAVSTGAPLNASLASGLLSINKHHGGAIEDCMRMIQEALDIAKAEEGDIMQGAEQLVTNYRQAKQRLPGFGHRIHTADPRTSKLLDMAEDKQIAGEAVVILQAIHRALHEQTGRDLPINVDGAIAGILLDMGIPTELGNAFFMMARVPGLVAHIYEEMTRERPMRRIHPTNHQYDGQNPSEDDS